MGPTPGLNGFPSGVRSRNLCAIEASPSPIRASALRDPQGGNAGWPHLGGPVSASRRGALSFNDLEFECAAFTSLSRWTDDRGRARPELWTAGHRAPATEQGHAPLASAEFLVPVYTLSVLLLREQQSQPGRCPLVRLIPGPVVPSVRGGRDRLLSRPLWLPCGLRDVCVTRTGLGDTDVRVSTSSL